MVKRFDDASFTAPMDSALLKLRSVLPRERQDDLDRLAKATALVGVPRLAAGLDQRTLLPIQQAVVARRVLRMVYRARGRAEDTVRDVEPLGVIYLNGGWYLVAWCRLRQDFRHFKLERLRRLEVLREQFPSRPDFSLKAHLEKERGGDETLAARVWFAEPVVDRARRENIAGFVKEHPVRGGLEVELRTFSLEWLARWLLSFGPQAEALAPAKLRQCVRAEAEAVAKRYSG